MRILIIEDDSRTLENLVKILKKQTFAIDQATNGQKGLDKAFAEDYDLILLDWMLPDLSGIEVCRQLRLEGKTTSILMLTAKSQLEDKLEGLNTGCDDYLTKPFAMEELLARIRALLRRRGHIAPTPLIEICDLKIDTISCRVWRKKQMIELSPKEYALLEYLARFKGQAINRIELLSHVWDENTDLFSNTVDVHIRYLRKKIDQGFKRKLIQTIKGRGYSLCTD